MTGRISDVGFRIVDQKKRPVRSHKSEIRNLAQQYLVGGVNSPVRAFKHVGAEALSLTQGRGAHVTDVQGRRYLDFIGGWGPLILGHAHPAPAAALRAALRSGTVLGLTHPAEAELARAIVESVPSIERVRFTASGTEACMTAVKLARACTGRTRLLRFAGCYHGHGDGLMAGETAGLPASVAADSVVVPYNDLAGLERAFAVDGKTLACAIIEPVAANMGVVPPTQGFLPRLRELATRHGALLIFDEVVTGFRLGPAGAQGRFGVSADLTTFGKIIGGGMPIGAVAGPARFMRRLAPEGDVYHGGTFAGHPLSMAAGLATLAELLAHPPYERIERLAEQAAEGVRRAARAAGVHVHVNQVGSMFTVFFSAGPVRNVAEARAADRVRFARWANALREQGILIPPSPMEAAFVSAAHTPAHINRLIAASRAAFAAMDA